MIPKKIHYCWLSNEKMPNNVLTCMKTWEREMPDYELVLWDKAKFNINTVPFVEEACSAKKWAFAADYIRLYALYTEGGIYLDTDVYVIKGFDHFLANDFFSAIEYQASGVKNKEIKAFLNEDGSVKEELSESPFINGIGIQAAILGSVKGHPYLEECLNWYKNKRFILPCGSYFMNLLAPSIYADVALKYGFRYKDEMQKLKSNMLILPSAYFASSRGQVSKNAFAIHCCENSWKNKAKSFKEMVYQKITCFNMIRKLYGKKPFLAIDDRVIHNYINV